MYQSILRFVKKRQRITPEAVTKVFSGAVQNGFRKGSQTTVPPAFTSKLTTWILAHNTVIKSLIPNIMEEREKRN